MLGKNVYFLQQKLPSKEELIKPLIDNQTMVIETISKQNQFKKPDKNLRNVVQYQHKNSIEKVHNTSQNEQQNIHEQQLNLE